MKMVTAIIQESKLDAVREALVEADVSRITVSRVSGHGRSMAEQDIYRGRAVTPNLIPKVRLEIACNDEFVEPAIEAICKAANSGTMGDGKIFVTPLDEIIRIRTGERGREAI